jgi:aspartate-semialdehyde dehydrogenase
MDGLCVRISSMRCHSQALTIKLTHDVPLAEIESRLAAAHEWVSVVPNDKESSLRELTPAAVTGTLRSDRPAAQDVDGGEYLTAFTGRRPAAVGRRRTVAPHAAHPARTRARVRRRSRPLRRRRLA